MTFEYSLTIHDLIAFARVVYSESEYVKRSAAKNRVLMGIVFFGLVLVLFESASMNVALGVAVALAVGAGASWRYPWYQRRVLAQRIPVAVTLAHSGGGEDVDLGARTLEISEAGVTEKTANTDLHYATAVIRRVLETPSHVLIFVAREKAFVVPFAAGSPERVRLLRQVGACWPSVPIAS